LILAVLALCLLTPAAASAKFSAARICGPSDCRTITFHDGQTLIDMEEPIMEGMEASGTGTTNVAGQPVSKEPDPRGPWYRVILCPGSCSANGAELVRVFPADRYAWMRQHWIELDDRALSAYRGAAEGIRPYEPVSTATDPQSDSGGTPAWVWVAIGAAVAGVALLVYRLARRGRRPASG
jgi:hypothetical protein